MSAPPPPKRVLLLTHARTASHLLEKLLSNQPNTVYASHPFAFARPLTVKSVEEGYAPEQQTKDELGKVWQDAFTSSWEPFFEKASQDGKTAFMHIHPHFSLQPALAVAYTHGEKPSLLGEFEPVVLKSRNGDDKRSQDNPEVLPDAELLAPGTVPVFTIRHPVLMVPSIYRTMKEVSVESSSKEAIQFSSTLRWQRLLYDFYAKHGPAHGINPVVVDADDYTGPDHQKFTAQLCTAIGLDSDHVQYTWSVASKSDLEGTPWFVAQIKKTILGSDKVLTGYDTASRDLEADKAGWVKEFGEEGASFVRSLVDKTMADYEYLKANKFNIS